MKRERGREREKEAGGGGGRGSNESTIGLRFVSLMYNRDLKQGRRQWQ